MFSMLGPYIKSSVLENKIKQKQPQTKIQPTNHATKQPPPPEKKKPKNIL